MDNFMNMTKDEGHTGELNRLTDLHVVYSDALDGKLVVAPLNLEEPGKRILEAGTADGLWLRDVRSSVSAAHEYFGSDIEAELFPTQQVDGIRYFQHSFNDPWPAQYLGTMDLVHLRGSLAGAAPNPPAATIRNLATLVRPGGWIQLQEINAFRPPSEGNGPAMHAFAEMIRGAWSGIGVGDFTNELKDMLGAAGLQNLHEKRVVVELGARAKPEVRAASVHGVTSPIKPLSSIARTVPSTLSLEQIDGMQARVKDELERQGGRIEIVIAYGQVVEACI